MLSGTEYSRLIVKYILTNFSEMNIKVYREVSLGKTIIGKNRRIDILVIDKNNKAFAIECKYQEVKGTTDEKLPYSMQDMESLPIRGCIVYAGNGFSQGVTHLLQASEIAAYCLPSENDLRSNKNTKELDHLLAMNFGWWDYLFKGKEPETL